MSEIEVLSIKNFNPDLLTDGKSKVYVPVKLTSMISKDGKRRLFNYTACLTDGVYMGTTRRESNGFLNEKILNNIIANNLANKSNKDYQVLFVEVNEETFNSYKDSILEIDIDNDF